MAQDSVIQAWAIGADSHDAGLHHDNNPYEPNSREWKAYKAGWLSRYQNTREDMTSGAVRAVQEGHFFFEFFETQDLPDLMRILASKELNDYRDLALRAIMVANDVTLESIEKEFGSR